MLVLEKGVLGQHFLFRHVRVVVVVIAVVVVLEGPPPPWADRVSTACGHVGVVARPLR